MMEAVIKKREVTTTSNEQRATRQHDQHHSRCIAILEHMTINGFHLFIAYHSNSDCDLRTTAQRPTAQRPTYLKWQHLNR